MNCENGYFVLGDASIDSQDSRYTGVVTKDRFLGRVWCVAAPAERRGFCVKTHSLLTASIPSATSVWCGMIWDLDEAGAEACDSGTI